MDYKGSLHFIDFISRGILDNGPLYCITLWSSAHSIRFYYVKSIDQSIKVNNRLKEIYQLIANPKSPRL
jgi:hypothetical protein